MDTSINPVVGLIAALRGARNPHVQHVHSGCYASCTLHSILKTEFLEATFMGGIREEMKE